MIYYHELHTPHGLAILPQGPEKRSIAYNTVGLGLLSGTSQRIKDSAENRCENAMASWEEVKSLLEEEAYKMADDFVYLCQQYYAFHCDIECSIDIVNEDSVMFDWNDGTLPAFTALITPGPSISFVGGFEYGTVKGKTSTLSVLKANLIHFVKEVGSEIWETSVLQDSWLRKKRASLVGEHGCILRQEQENSPSSAPRILTAATSQRPGYTLRDR